MSWGAFAFLSSVQVNYGTNASKAIESLGSVHSPFSAWIGAWQNISFEISFCLDLTHTVCISRFAYTRVLGKPRQVLPGDRWLVWPLPFFGGIVGVSKFLHNASKSCNIFMHLNSNKQYPHILLSAFNIQGTSRKNLITTSLFML